MFPQIESSLKQSTGTFRQLVLGYGCCGATILWGVPWMLHPMAIGLTSTLIIY